MSGASRELIVIGAGPAGMAAAITAADHGANVLLLDEQPGPGGQIYRGVTNAAAARGDLLGADYLAGRRLTDRLDHPLIDYRPGAKVWRVDDDGQICFSIAQAAQCVSARQIVIATGALERPVPIPGWTLPGAMTAGAAQILLKTSGLAPENAVLAGSGPLLYLLATQMVRAGTAPRAIVETQRHSHYLAASRHLPRAAGNWRTLKKGLDLLAELRRAGVRRYRAAAALEITGDAAVDGIRFQSAGRAHHLECNAVLLHQGVVPNTQISRLLRLEHHWHPLQRCFVPAISATGQSDNPLFHIAGDGAEINGAIAAEQQGVICALQALHQLKRIDRATQRQAQATAMKTLARERAMRAFIDTLYAPSPQIVAPANETIICRCEEVTAGTIRRQVARGCTGPNQTKAFSRCGMGPCQGRYCGLTVTEILASENGLSHDEVGAYRIRAPIKPVTLAELASLHTREGDVLP